MNEIKAKRPIGIIIISILHLAGAVLGSLFVLLFFMLSMFNEEAKNALETIGIPPVLLLIAILFLCILSGLAGIGMLLRQKWGWFLGGLSYAYSVVRNTTALFAISGIMGNMPASELSGMTYGAAYYYGKHGVRIIVSGLIYLYFFKRNVFEYFGLNINKRWFPIAAHVVICIVIVVSFNIAARFMIPAETLETKILALNELYDQGDFEGVIEEANDYLDTHPNAYMVLSQLGWAHLKIHELDKADMYFNRAITIEPTWDNAYVGLGVLCREKGDTEGARKNYLKAISIVPDNAEAYSSLLVIELMEGNDSKAVEYGEKAWSLRKDDANIAANLAVAYHYLGDMEKRNVFVEYARMLGYYNMDALQDIFDGKTSLR